MLGALTLRIADGQGPWWEVHRRGRQCVSLGSASFSENGAENEDSHSRWSAAELGLALEDWICRTGGRGEDLQLGYLTGVSCTCSGNACWG